MICDKKDESTDPHDDIFESDEKAIEWEEAAKKEESDTTWQFLLDKYPAASVDQLSRATFSFMCHNDVDSARRILEDA